MTTVDLELEILALEFMARDAISHHSAKEADAYVDRPSAPNESSNSNRRRTRRMCTQAAKTAESLLVAEKPTLDQVLTVTGQINTPAGQAIEASYAAALTALQNWKTGTVATEVLEGLEALQGLVGALPIPPIYQTGLNLVLAGIVAVIGVIQANSPAPAAPVGATAPAEQIPALHQTAVIQATSAKIAVLAPGFAISAHHSPVQQYKQAWNGYVGTNPDLGLTSI